MRQFLFNLAHSHTRGKQRSLRRRRLALPHSRFPLRCLHQKSWAPFCTCCVNRFPVHHPTISPEWPARALKKTQAATAIGPPLPHRLSIQMSCRSSWTSCRSCRPAKAALLPQQSGHSVGQAAQALHHSPQITSKPLAGEQQMRHRRRQRRQRDVCRQTQRKVEQQQLRS